MPKRKRIIARPAVIAVCAAFGMVAGAYITTLAGRNFLGQAAEDVTMPPANTWQSPFDSRQAPLGCFTKGGTWTEDRSKCAEDQGPFIGNLLGSGTVLAVTGGTIPDPDTWAAIDALFTRSGEKEAKAAGLQTGVQAAVDVLTNLQRQGLITPEIQDAVVEHARVLRTFLADIDTLRVEELDDRIAAAQKEILALSKTLSVIPPPAGPAPSDAEIAAVAARMSRIVATGPKVQNFLTDKEVLLPPAAADALAEAQKADALVKECAALAHCNALPDLADALLRWQNVIQTTLVSTGHSELLSTIGAMTE